MKFQQKLILIAIAGTILAVFWQELNSSFLGIGGEPRFGMVATADDASYLAPPKNFIDKGVWADNSEGLSRYFQRPPGYGMIFGLFHLLLRENALVALKLLQIGLYFLTLLFTGKIIHSLTSSEKWTIATSLIMAILPMYSGFMYYTLTEAITPFLLIWSVYSFLSARSIFGLTVPFALLLLVRPQLMIFPIILLLFAIIQKEKIKTLALSFAFIPIALWMIRSTIIAEEFQGIHPIYSDTNVSLYRPGHAAMTDLFRIWESDGETFHQTIACLSGVKDKKDLDKCTQSIPGEFLKQTKPLIEEYHHLLQRADYAHSADFNLSEKAFVKKVQSTRKQIITHSMFTHHIATPAKSALYLLSKSQLNLNIFQDKFRGNVVMELVRWICILTINLGMLGLIIQLFRRRNKLITFLSASVLIYFFYLIYFQRMNEERYLTPLLPILLVILIMSLYDLRSKKNGPSKGSIFRN